MKRTRFLIFSIIILSTALLFSSSLIGSTNWWDEKFGQPKYGGTISSSSDMDPFGMGFDPYSSWGAPLALETLWHPSWTIDREVWPFTTPFTPSEYVEGLMVESWEQTTPVKLIVHIKKGIHWQDKEPVNGREFTADDVAFHYDRMLGTGHGFTIPSPMNSGRISFLKKVTALDKYTAQFEYKYPTAVGFLGLLDAGGQNIMEAPEWVALAGPPPSAPPAGGGPGPGGPKGGGPGPAGPKGGEKGPGGPKKGLAPSGPLNDWHKVVGTGPWVLTDYVTGSSVTYTKNPNYYGFDERHPENQLPYTDEYKILVIGDKTTAMAALRTGKIVGLGGLTWQQAGSLAKSNPELKQGTSPTPGYSVEMRPDRKPFTDIRVRKALQLAIDIKAIAKAVYGGTVAGEPCGLIHPLFNRAGYGLPYKDWPQSLKDEYSYNPEKAKKLLADAGYPQGFKTNVIIGSNSDMSMIQIIKDQFKDIGVDMEIRPMDMMSMRAFLQAGKQDQMSGAGKTGVVFPVVVVIGSFKTNDGANYAHISDPNYDALVEKFNSADTLEEAKRISREADQYFLEQHWDVVTCPYFNYNIWQPYLKGFSGESIGGGPTDGTIWARLWIDQDLKKSMGH